MFLLEKIKNTPPQTLAFYAFVIRLVLIIYSVFHDAFFTVAYTDVDYLVVSDGAKHMYEGRSPFDRETYRYTPLLALVVLPNLFLGAWWGKMILAFCDVVAGWFVFHVLMKTSSSSSSSSTGKTPIRNSNNNNINENEKYAKLLVSFCIWFNPIVVNVSTRGNSDIIIAALTLGSLVAFVQKNFWIAGTCLGFAIHMKIYPIIYAAPFVFCLFYQNSGFFSINGFIVPVIKSAVATIAGAVVPTVGCYLWYGQQFLDEAILYHVGRVDHRHNLSPYFLQMYYGLYDMEEKKMMKNSEALSVSSSPLTSNLFAFIPQVLMLLVVSWILRKNAAHALAVETMLFVAFNKVCTVQYFVWYLPFLPFLFFSSASSSSGSSTNKNNNNNMFFIGVFVYWVLSLGIWMLHGKLLEFDGEDTFSQLWLCSCFFFIGQVLVAGVMLRVALNNQENEFGGVPKKIKEKK